MKTIKAGLNLKKIPKKWEWFVKSGYKSKKISYGYTIPVPPQNEKYGSPLFVLEPIFSNKLEKFGGLKRRCLIGLNVGVPHAEREGYTTWYHIPCKAESFELPENGRWLLMTPCDVHLGGVSIRIYPPKGAKELKICTFTSCTVDAQFI